MADVDAILRGRYPADIVKALLDAYREIESNYSLEKWKPSELDAGHFVEAARRILEHELFGQATPINQQISKFTDQVLTKYEQATGDESYRMLIPRALKSVYNIRNKRGVGHIGGVSPNEMDATYILYSVKWVLAELVRLASGLSIAETQEAVDDIVERRLSVLWKHGDITRILDTSLDAREQVLVLLYDTSPQAEMALRETIEYANAARFRTILKKLHTARLIHYQTDGTCLITPKGLIEAEQIIRDLES